MKLSAMRAAFPDTIPVLTGYLFLGGGFGILLAESGYSVLWAGLMGLVVFAGSGQYLLVGLLASGASLASTAVATLLVNARHLFYGISLVDTYREDYCFWVTLLNHSYWIAGCILGAVVGTVVPIDFSGVSFVLTALFVTIFVEQWLSNKDHFPAMVGIVCTTLSLLGFGSDIFLIPAMAAIALILILRRRFGKEAAHG